MQVSCNGALSHEKRGMCFIRLLRIKTKVIYIKKHEHWENGSLHVLLSHEKSPKSIFVIVIIMSHFVFWGDFNWRQVPGQFFTYLNPIHSIKG